MKKPGTKTAINLSCFSKKIYSKKVCEKRVVPKKSVSTIQLHLVITYLFDCAYAAIEKCLFGRINEASHGWANYSISYLTSWPTA